MSTYNGITFSAPPPPGVTPDANAPRNATRLTVVYAIFFPIAVVSTVARIYTRAAIVGKVSLDDYLMVAALLCSAVMLGFVWNMLNDCLGRHLWDVPLTPNLYPNFLYDNLLSAIFFCLATGLAKGSILLFYLRIFPGKHIKLAVWMLFTFIIAYSVASAFVNVFSCKPIEGSWQLKYATTAHCINRPAFYFAQAAFGIFSDIATVCLPIPVLKTLHLPMRQKVGVAALLTVGGFVCVVSIIRLQSLDVLLKGTDLTYETTTAMMWCVLELQLSIFGGNITAIKPFLQRLFPRLFPSTAANTSNARYVRSGSAGGGLSGVKNSATASITSPYSSKNRHTRPAIEESGSEEYIMTEQNITKTVEYGFDYRGQGA